LAIVFLNQNQCSEQVATGQLHGCKNCMGTLFMHESDLLIKHFLQKVRERYFNSCNNSCGKPRWL